MRAIVIKQDGTVPFDHDLPDEHRVAMLGDLADMGHTLKHVDKPHPEHGGKSHAVLLSGPHCKAEQDARRAAEAEARAKEAGGKGGGKQ
jgi:hypothetical protein